MKKLKSFFISIIPISTITFGIAIVNTSCAAAQNPYYETNQVRIFTNETDKKYQDLTTVSNSLNNLISGTTEYNNGNYLLIIGSTANNNDTGLLKPSDNWNGATYILNRLSNSLKEDFVHPSSLLIYQDVAPAENDQASFKTNFPGFNNVSSGKVKPEYLLLPEGMEAKSSGGYITDESILLNPFVKYASDENITQIANDYRGQYIRNDESAKEYRELIWSIQKLNISSLSSFSYTNPIVIMSKLNNKNDIAPTLNVKQFSDANVEPVANDVVNFFGNK